MNAFHCLCSKPFFLETSFFMEDYQILTMILSALTWKQNNGKIKLVADKKAMDFIKEKGLAFLWDFDIEELPDLNINYRMFWAGAKIIALSMQKAPVIMIDLDMIVWENIYDRISTYSVVAIHDEPIVENIYKEQSYFKMIPGYTFDVDFDWQVKPSNTALLYIKEEAFKRYYCEESLKFMYSAKDVEDTLSYMVFAEQRLLSMCAKKKEIPIGYLMKFPRDIGNQDTFTHLWGYKNVLNQNEEEKRKYCCRCVRRIQKEFPREAERLIQEEFFSPYI